MDRSLRAFRPVASPLEGRLLLTGMDAQPPVLAPILTTITAPALAPVTAPDLTPVTAPAQPPSVSFVGKGSSIYPMSTSVNLVKLVPQGASTATILLRANQMTSSSSSPVTVRVTTDPSSPAVGVNVGAVDQTVTFAAGQFQAAVNVPIIAGAPNAGVVEVQLNLTPLDPTNTVIYRGSLMLEILESNPASPPQILSASPTPQGLAITFNKPMNPIGASNVHNYAVHHVTSYAGFGYPATTSLVPLKSATYDPATFTVTLVAKQRHQPGQSDAFAGSYVTQGRGASTSARMRHGAGAAQGLMDLAGQRIENQKIRGRFQVVTD